MEKIKSLKRMELTSLDQLATNPNTVFIVKNEVSYHKPGIIIPSDSGNKGKSSISGPVIIPPITNNHPYKIAENVTLIFEGGSIGGLKSGNETHHVTLKGDKTSIQAPICQIFNSYVTLEGSWVTDRAYPQWFDENVGKQPYHSKTADIVDCAPAINKAIAMKQIGDVFLPYGNYFVATSINLRTGVNLIGEWQACQSVHGDPNASDLDKWGMISLIIPYIPVNANRSDVLKSPIVNINIDSTKTTGEGGTLDSSWERALIQPARMSGLVFHNYAFDNSSTQKFADMMLLANKVCCLVAGGFEFNNVKWEYFRRAIKWTSDDYADSKRVLNCMFSQYFNDNDLSLFPETFNSEGNMIESRSHGDALLIQGCHFEGYLAKNAITHNAIRISRCHGGSIRNNIINGDVIISNSDAMTFTDNHMESGARLTIISSVLEVSNNWIEKGNRPSILIDFPNDTPEPVFHNDLYSIINLNGNEFRYWNTMDERPNIAALASEYDIELSKLFDTPVSIMMRQNFRLPYNELKSNMPSGIAMCYSDGTPVESFNKYSYFLSRECSFLWNGGIKAFEYINPMPDLSLHMMCNSGIPKVNDKGIKPKVVINPPKYSFQAWAVIDPVRKIGKSVDIHQPENNEPYNDNGESYGMLIVLFWHNLSRSCQLLLKRKGINVEDGPHFVAVPLCGPKYIYDNSVSVNGYRWSTVNPYSSETFNTNIENVEFKGSNVVCQAAGLPEYGEWTDGDIIINTNLIKGENGTAESSDNNGANALMWIRRNNSWIPLK